MILLIGNQLRDKIKDMEVRLRKVERALAKHDEVAEDVGLNTPLEEVERSVDAL